MGCVESSSGNSSCEKTVSEGEAALQRNDTAAAADYFDKVAGTLPFDVFSKEDFSPRMAAQDAPEKLICSLRVCSEIAGKCKQYSSHRLAEKYYQTVLSLSNKAMTLPKDACRIPRCNTSALRYLWVDASLRLAEIALSEARMVDSTLDDTLIHSALFHTQCAKNVIADTEGTTSESLVDVLLLEASINEEALQWKAAVLCLQRARGVAACRPERCSATLSTIDTRIAVASENASRCWSSAELAATIAT